MLQCQFNQPLFSEIILQIYFTPFLLDSQTFCKLGVEMFPRETGKESEKGQQTLPTLQ